jgi:hypothetical protein
MQQNEIYNIPLPPGPGPKNKKQKKATKVGQITQVNEKRRIPHGDTNIYSGRS